MPEPTPLKRRKSSPPKEPEPAEADKAVHINIQLTNGLTVTVAINGEIIVERKA